MAFEDEQRQLDAVQAALVQEFAALPTDRVTDALATTVAGFDGAPIRTFVPVLVQRQVRHALGKELAAR